MGINETINWVQQTPQLIVGDKWVYILFRVSVYTDNWTARYAGNKIIGYGPIEEMKHLCEIHKCA